MNSTQQNVLKHMKTLISEALENGAEPLAAFDADGTLWKHDIGEEFFQFQLQNKLIKNLPNSPWEYYKNLYNEGDTSHALSWLARINQGHSVEEVREWTKDYVVQNPPPFFDIQKELISYLHSVDVEVFVVTASVKWVVEAGAELIGIDSNHVLGVEAETDDRDIILDKAKLPITWKEGKATGLLQKTKQKKPFLVSGNSTGDLALLESSTHIRWTLHSATPSQDVYSSERDLLEISKIRDWQWFDFTTT